MKKECIRCGRQYEITEGFHKSSKSKDGYRPECKSCRGRRRPSQATGSRNQIDIYQVIAFGESENGIDYMKVCNYEFAEGGQDA
jgi:NAD-dependent SIR2 family protein deacetylase